MLLTSTNQLQWQEIEYIGFISSEVIQWANFVRDIFASFSDFFGWRSSKYETTLIRWKNMAIDELKEKAKAAGADAVIGIDMDYEAIGKWTMFMINVSGTAVKFKGSNTAPTQDWFSTNKIG